MRGGFTLSQTSLSITSLLPHGEEGAGPVVPDQILYNSTLGPLMRPDFPYPFLDGAGILPPVPPGGDFWVNGSVGPLYNPDFPYPWLEA